MAWHKTGVTPMCRWPSLCLKMCCSTQQYQAISRYSADFKFRHVLFNDSQAINDFVYFCYTQWRHSEWPMRSCGIEILNMLNCFKDYKRRIHISYRILDFVQQRKTRFTMEQPYLLPILYCQYHACWCPGNLRSQGISRHGMIGLQHQKI